MRQIFCAASLMMALLTGCNSAGTSSAPGTGPYIDSNKNSPRKLEVSVSKDVTVHQDKADQFTVSITRTRFAGPVAIALPALPSGVTLETKDLTIPADKTSLALTIKAAPNAKVMDKQHAKVTAKAIDEKDLPEATTEFEINVKSK